MRRLLLLALAAAAIPSGAAAGATADAMELSLTASPAPEPAIGAFDFGVEYAQSAQAWSTYGQILDAKDNLPAINAVLKSNYGMFEETFGEARARLEKINTHLAFAPLAHAYFEANSQAVATAVAENPVVPELHAAAMAAGEVDAGFEYTPRGTGFRLTYGGVLGSGYEKRVDAYSTDIIDSAPVRVGNFFYYGADVAASERIRLGRGWDLRLGAADHETMFVSQVPPASLSYGAESPFWDHRWRADAEAGLTARWAGGRLFVQGIAGPQPLPTEILPRLWDYAHALDPLPELGAMLGGGLGWERQLGGRGFVRAAAGFYGGYPGGEVAARIGALKLSVATYGLEASSAFQTLGQQLWLAGLGLAI